MYCDAEDFGICNTGSMVFCGICDKINSTSGNASTSNHEFENTTENHAIVC